MDPTTLPLFVFCRAARDEARHLLAVAVERYAHHLLEAQAADDRCHDLARKLSAALDERDDARRAEAEWSRLLARAEDHHARVHERALPRPPRAEMEVAA